MLLDELSRFLRVGSHPIWTKVNEFLCNASVEIEKGEYPIQGQDAFARVISYQTQPAETATLETHREYIDVQILLSGIECIDWYAIEGLVETAPYNPEKDATFYLAPPEPGSRLRMVPGRVAVFFPEDAHRPGIQANESPCEIKKIVVKVRLAALS